MDELAKKYKEIADRAGVSRATIYRWQKSGEMDSELAKRGVKLEPGYLEDPQNEGSIWAEGEVKEEPAPWGTRVYIRTRAGDGSMFWCATPASDEEIKWKDRASKKTREIINERDPGSMRTGDEHFQSVNKISTGLPELDIALGSGVAEGKLIEIFGRNSTGKTSLAIKIAANFQKLGKKVAYFDAENAMDMEYAQALGLNISLVDWNTTFIMEKMMESLRDICRTGSADLAIIDSVASLVPNPEQEGMVGDANMMMKARLMSQICRMISGNASKNNVTVLFINQLRDGIGPGGYPYHFTPGGHALLYHCTQRMEIKDVTKKQTSVKPGDRDDKKEVEITVVKNKAGKPGRSVKLMIEFGKGFVE